MKKKLIILGCGSSVGIPRIDGSWGKCNRNEKKNYRTRCSAIIIKGKNSVLIDTSPDLRQQLILNKIQNISSVIYTHEHADQTNGLFELRPFFWKNKKKINVYGDPVTIKNLKRRQDYLFKNINSYPAIAKANIVNSKFSLGAGKERIFFSTITVTHGKTKSLGYIFEKTAYISDCNDLSIIKFKSLKNLKYLVIDCLKYDKHPSHFNLSEAIYVHNHLRPFKTILTNLSHDLDYRSLYKKLPTNVVPAYDGLKLSI
tara:strand:- start:960 stop:1730 length:771 start_codon:yes stop_codon:yes gene_type:complete